MQGIYKEIFLTRKGLPTVIEYVQWTNGITINLKCMDYIIPDGAEARIYVKKPSGNEVYNPASISGNTIIIDPTTQMFAEEGGAMAQVQILTGAKVAATFLLAFDVEKNIISESAVESTNEYAVLDSLIADARGAISEAETAVENAAQAKKNAETAAAQAEKAAESANAAAAQAEKAADDCETEIQAALNAARSALAAAQAAAQAAQEVESATASANAALAAAQKVLNEWQGLEDASRVTALEEAVADITKALSNVLAVS